MMLAGVWATAGLLAGAAIVCVFMTELPKRSVNIPIGSGAAALLSQAPG